MNRNLILMLLMIESFCIPAYGQINSDIRVINDLRYVDSSMIANDSLQRLNLILPANVKEFPLVMWIGGGAWSYVNRDMEMDLGKRFASKGIAFASVGHRLSTAVWKDSTLNRGIKHPEHVRDVANAFKWICDMASEYGYNRENIYVGGFSSGAHLATLLSMDTTYLAKVGLSQKDIKGILAISGAYDILNYYEVFLNSETSSAMAETHVKAVFGETRSDFLKASPSEYVSSLAMPMLLITDDNLDDYTRIFEEKLLTTGFSDYQILYIHNMGHGELWKHLSYDEISIYRDLMIN